MAGLRPSSVATSAIATPSSRAAAAVEVERPSSERTAHRGRAARSGHGYTGLAAAAAPDAGFGTAAGSFGCASSLGCTSAISGVMSTALRRAVTELVARECFRHLGAIRTERRFDEDPMALSAASPTARAGAASLEMGNAGGGVPASEPCFRFRRVLDLCRSRCDLVEDVERVGERQLADLREPGRGAELVHFFGWAAAGAESGAVVRQ